MVFSVSIPLPPPYGDYIQNSRITNVVANTTSKNESYSTWIRGAFILVKK